MAILIKPDGSMRNMFPESGELFSLKEMYTVLNCSLVQCIYLDDGRIMWIDEEGKLKPHFANPRATRLLKKAGGMEGDYIAGLALITEQNEIQ